LGWPALLGGGWPVGAVLLVEEDDARQYSGLVARFFLAEGVAHGHAIALFAADERPARVLDGKEPP
jgi:hypothetical protein